MPAGIPQRRGRPGAGVLARIAVAVAAVALIGGAAWLWHAHQAGAAQGAPGPGGPRRGDRPQPVAVATAAHRDIAHIVPAIGTIAAASTATVKAKVEGELKALFFKEGQQVAAGTLLAELDRRPFEIALAQAEGQLARDKAQWQNAQLDLARFRDLLGKDGISRQQVDTQAAQVAQLAGTVQISQAAVDNARLQLSYTRIVAPIAGRIGLRQVDIGNVVKPGDAQGLFTIAQTRPAYGVFAVPDSHLAAIRQQQQAGESLQVEAWDRAQQQRLAVGQVNSVDNTLDATTGTLKLKAAFANRDDSLVPNQFVNVRLQLGVVRHTLAVPATAVLRNQEGPFVYVAEPGRDGAPPTARLVPVTTGAADRDWVAVHPLKADALHEGDRVVVDGTDRIRDGAKLLVLDPAARGAAVPDDEASGRPRRPRANRPPAP